MKKFEVEVYETKDYDVFKRLEGNRDIRNVNKIVESIKKVGYIFNPIMVNENMEVIDGQNRLKALERCGLPVHYYIVKNADIETARALNLGRTNWKPIDYVRSYAEEGIKSYQLFNTLLEENKDVVTLQILVGIVKNRIIQNGTVNVITELSQGDFRMSKKEYDTSQEIIDTLRSLKEVTAALLGSKRAIITTLAWCLRIDEIDTKKFVSCLQSEYPKIRPIVDGKTGVEMFLQDITKIYNKKSSKKINFDVIYRDL